MKEINEKIIYKKRCKIQIEKRIQKWIPFKGQTKINHFILIMCPPVLHRNL